MSRIGYGRHKKIVTGSQHPSAQVSKDEWNDDLSTEGMFGYTPSIITLSSNSLTPVDTFTIVAAESGSADNLETVDNTNTEDGDTLKLVSDTGDAITVKHGADNIFLIDGKDRIISEHSPLLLVRRGANWYEYGGQTTFSDDTFQVHDDSDPTKKLVFSLSEMTTGKTLTIKSDITDNTEVYLI